MVCEGGAGDLEDEVALAAPLQRLSVHELEAAVTSVFGPAGGDVAADALAGLPEDDLEEEGAFPRQDQRVTGRHVDGFFAVADALAQATAADGALRQRAGGACAEGIDPGCVEAFVPVFLERALRRMPSEAEVGDALALVDEMGGGADGVHAVVFTTLMAPDFLYRFENRGAVDGDVQTLTPFELASRLSFHFWGEPPDQALFDLAATGDLTRPEVYAEEVDRLFSDPRTDATLASFFGEWFHLERGRYSASPRLDALAGDVALDGLAAEMREETLDLVTWIVRSDEGTWDDLLTSDLSLARTSRLAGLYGVEPWDGTGSPPRFPAGQRAGLLTRSGVLQSADGSTNPFRRGAFLKRLVLCDGLPPPPADLPPDALSPPEVEEGATTRQAFAAKVVDEPCATCHQGFSALGYALEAYDGLGRFRTEERLVTTGGEDRGTAAVDATVEVSIDGPAEVIDGPVALSQAIAATSKSSWCLSRQYFRFAFRRTERPDDRCTLERWTAAIEAGQPLGAWLRAVALDRSFKTRKIITD